MADDGAPPATQFLPGGIRALNLGLAGFAEPLRAHGASVVQLQWRPPAEGDRDLGLLLARLEDDPDDPVGARVREANGTAVARLLGARALLVDVQPAGVAIARLPAPRTGGGAGTLAGNLPAPRTSGPAPRTGGGAGTLAGNPGPRTLLHAGPPIAWAEMCGPMRGAVIGALLYEGWAETPDAAAALAARDEIELVPCHDAGAVGPMAGVVSPSMPVVVVENPAHGNRAFATLNEGLGKVLRFGAYAPEVLDRLRWLATTLAPALRRALQAGGPIDLRLLTAQALQMGDEGHNRNVAATALFVRTIAPALVRSVDGEIAATVLEFLHHNPHFFLNLSMAACKAALDAAHGVAGSTVVTAMARNGVEFGLRLSGTGSRWFTAPAPVVDGLYFPGYGPDDANPDLGDSAITETAGIGGFAMAAAPAIVRFVGGSPAEALGYTQAMYRITLARNADFALPALGFAGTPTAIDARRVVETGITPVINTGLAHREPGIGQIGAGIARAPLACFRAALEALGAQLGVPA